VPCADQHLDLVRCFRDGRHCRAEHDAFWACMQHHQPAHRDPANAAVPAFLKNEAWPWLVEGAGRLKAWAMGGGGGGGAGSSGGGEGGAT
jgi:hypothetical protein